MKCCFLWLLRKQSSLYTCAQKPKQTFHTKTLKRSVFFSSCAEHTCAEQCPAAPLQWPDLSLRPELPRLESALPRCFCEHGVEGTPPSTVASVSDMMATSFNTIALAQFRSRIPRTLVLSDEPNGGQVCVESMGTRRLFTGHLDLAAWKLPWRLSSSKCLMITLEKLGEIIEQVSKCLCPGAGEENRGYMG